MRKSKASRIIEKIAANDGISTEEMRREVQRAIETAYAGGTADEQIKKFWRKWQKREPTPEEFINSASTEVLKRLVVVYGE